MNDVLFYHGKTVDGRRFTIAGNVYDNRMVLAMSVCSKKDGFVKKTGRLKASGRLKAISNRGNIVLPMPIANDEKIKTFITVASKFNFYVCKQLLDKFNLLNHDN